MSFRPHIERAVALHGSQTKLARAMGCSQQYISWLLKEADQISAETAMGLEKATSGSVKASDIRPDLPWPVPTQPNEQGDDEQGAHADERTMADPVDAHEVVPS